MLPIDIIEKPELGNIRAACACLFSPESAGRNSFLRGLEPEAVEKAYREKAKMYNPDLSRTEPGEIPEKREERLKKINRSHKFLTGICRKYPQPFSATGDRRGKIIAVGGAKGGIGKSVFSANLGVFLSSRGWRTVAVDLDLGGSNLNLYLGKTSIDKNINEFLNNWVSSLEDISIDNDYGPRLIGGDSSELGAANISFVRKLKLLRAIKKLDADYVVIDLGGDISYNVMDFFLAADYQLVMTTRDPASYLDAYRFIKVAMYRKLNRMFGPESRYCKRKDRALERLIHEATLSPNGRKVSRIGELTKRIRIELPGSLPLVNEVISDFKPYLIVNKVTDDFDPLDIVRTIQQVSRKMLSIEVEHLGNIPYRAETELSARELVPVVSKYPDGDMARAISALVGQDQGVSSGRNAAP